MDSTVADLNPKTLDNAKRQFVELYGSALVLNTYLKLAVACDTALRGRVVDAELPHAGPIRARQTARDTD